MITLTALASMPPEAGAAVFDLSDTFAWTDDQQWGPIRKSSQYLLPDESGVSALLIKTGRVAAGRPIILTGWIELFRLEILRLWEAADIAMSLALHGRNYHVIFFSDSENSALRFSRHGGPAESPQSEHFYYGTISLLEIPE